MDTNTPNPTEKELLDGLDGLLDKLLKNYKKPEEILAEQSLLVQGQPSSCVQEASRRKTAYLNAHLLAPVRNDRRSAGKTTAVNAGSDVCRHAGAIVGGRVHDESSQETRMSYKVAILPCRQQELEMWNAARVWCPA